MEEKIKEKLIELICILLVLTVGILAGSGLRKIWNYLLSLFS